MADFPTLEAEQAFDDLRVALHDSIIFQHGGSRLDTAHHKIKPMGTRSAAKTLGISESTLRSKASREAVNHPFTMRDLVILIASKMDTAPLDVLERLAGRVACKVVESESVKDLMRGLLQVMAQDGVLAQTFNQATDPTSPSGSGWSPSEVMQMIRELERTRQTALSMQIAMERMLEHLR